jgi:hypothetical protein
MSTRGASNRLLWGAVKRLPGGEAELRAAVAAVNDQDGTNQALRGTDDYRSTKNLTDAQLAGLADRFRASAGLPPPSRQARGPRGGKPRRPDDAAWRVTYIASKGEQHYIDYLRGIVDMAPEKWAAFVERQTRGAGLATHVACNAVIAPLERMLRARGYDIVEKDRIKTVRLPTAGKSTSAVQA